MATLISGSLAYDYIMNFPDSFRNHIMPDKIHILNVCFVVDQLEKSWGGTAGNIAFTIKLLGGDPYIVSALGRDGIDYLHHFETLDISTNGIIMDEKQLSSSAYITTDADDNQITAFYNGPLSRAIENSINNIKLPIKIALISPTEKGVMIQHIKECRELGIRAVFDPGQQITAFDATELQMMIGQAHAVIGNDYEMKLLQERTGWDTKKMLESVDLIITTLGEKGSVITTKEEMIEVKSCPPLSFDDPTGAGDAYRAGFFFGYEQGLDLKTCAQIGSVAASYAIETYGTQAHRFTKEEFAERYEKTYGETIAL